MSTVDLRLGDCRDVLLTLPEGSVDSIVTDPPYELGFMGKGWDKSGIAVDPVVWQQCFRVLKAGGHLLAFGGTRTHHRIWCAIEDAGFEIRDTMGWIYGSGFPKSLNIGKTNPEWEGWGTALKPAWEPIIVARKPLSEKTVAANVLKHGTGAINVDAGRVGTTDDLSGGTYGGTFSGSRNADGSLCKAVGSGDKGRFPANIIHDGSEEVLEVFPNTGTSKGRVCQYSVSDFAGDGGFGNSGEGQRTYEGSGSASRFFYCAKASKSERDKGCEGLEEKQWVQFQTGNGASGNPSSISEGRDTKYRNHHPTVKPLALMRYLCKLVTPPNGTVLDLFTGSGTTGMAAVSEGFSFIGIEKEPEYADIARRRIDSVRKDGLFE